MSDDQVLALTENDESEIRRSLRLDDKGEHRVALCPFCSVPRWQSTQLDGPAKIVARIDDGCCHSCEVMFERYPEVCRWIASVFAGQRFLDGRRAQAAKETG
jgi:hypothetical protein